MTRAKDVAVPKANRIDVEDDTKVGEDDDPLGKNASDYQLLRGEEPKLNERKERLRAACNAELCLGPLMCSFCDVAPTGARSSAGADAVAKLIQVLDPTRKTWVDRGDRSLAGQVQKQAPRREEA